MSYHVYLYFGVPKLWERWSTAFLGWENGGRLSSRLSPSVRYLAEFGHSRSNGVVRSRRYRSLEIGSFPPFGWGDGRPSSNHALPIDGLPYRIWSPLVWRDNQILNYKPDVHSSSQVRRHGTGCRAPFATLRPWTVSRRRWRHSSSLLTFNSNLILMLHACTVWTIVYGALESIAVLWHHRSHSDIIIHPPPRREH